MPDRVRLDVLLAEKDYFLSRSKAKRAIMAGKVYVNDEKVDKAGTQVKKDDRIEVRGERLPFVSRGGLKLQKALKVFSVKPEEKKVIDVGASTGGFTDCLLQSGAEKVYAVDVGYGQLAWKLRQDDRVEVIERTNFRYLTPEDLSITVPLIVIDVSFISLRLIIPSAVKFLADKGDIIALIKPQFEAGRERLGDGGVVRDSTLHCDILRELIPLYGKESLEVKGIEYSPIKGASGSNIEFLIHLQKKRNPGNKVKEIYEMIDRVVESAHQEL